MWRSAILLLPKLSISSLNKLFDLILKLWASFISPLAESSSGGWFQCTSGNFSSRCSPATHPARPCLQHIRFWPHGCPSASHCVGALHVLTHHFFSSVRDVARVSTVTTVSKNYPHFTFGFLGESKVAHLRWYNKWKNWTFNPDPCLRLPAFPLHCAALPSPFLKTCRQSSCSVLIHFAFLEDLYISVQAQCKCPPAQMCSLSLWCHHIVQWLSVSSIPQQGPGKRGFCHSGGSSLSGESPSFMISLSQPLFS